jgi:hypothetical protein
MRRAAAKNQREKEKKHIGGAGGGVGVSLKKPKFKASAKTGGATIWAFFLRVFFFFCFRRLIAKHLLSDIYIFL